MIKQIEQIKRTAQLLFDNAEMIADELNKSENYRQLSVDFDFFKHSGGFHVDLKIYDSTVSHYYLKEERICIGGLKRLFKQMNEDTGVEPLPKPAKVRSKL